MGSDPAGRVVVLCHDPHQIDGVVARLIDVMTGRGLPLLVVPAMLGLRSPLVEGGPW